MKKSTLTLIITSIFGGFNAFNAYSQNNPRMENPDYAKTVFYDDFETGSNWRDNWNPGSNGVFTSPNFGNILIWVDSTATIHQSLGSLHLTAREYEGYTYTDSENHQITADYISGTVKSKDRFLYGVFECNATFGYNPGSFPAFWLYYDTACVYDYGPEIDIVELKYEDPTPGLDNHAYYYPCEGGYHEVPDSWKDNPFNWSTLNSHTFKCIWTPTKTEWYVDNTKLHTIYDTGNNHYPNKSMVIILCQQLWPYDEDLDNIDVPVASTFHWVRAKEFFLAPEITITDPICTTGTAVLDVAPNAKNIQWSLSPSYLFSGSTTGTGKNATIYAAAGVRGEGKIIYQFDMEGINGDEHFTAERNVWVGKPQIYAYGNHIVDVNTGMPVYDLCYGTHNDVEAVHPAGDASITDWDWQVSYGQVYPYGSIDQYATIYPNDYQSFMLEIRACNACGYSDWAHMYTNVVDCGRFLLVFTPNPTTGETTLSIESESQEKTFDKNTEWEMEIYNQSQLLKEKKTSLRGQSTKIQTQGWKEGVYIVRVKYKDEILQGKLIVKK